MYTKTLAEISAALHAKKVSSEELTRDYLNRISSLNGDINAYITVTKERAMADAQRADVLLAKGEAGPLTGIPIAHKDIFCTRGVRTSCASRMLDNFIAPYDATCVTKLAEAGVVSLGKTNMDEFAMGSSNETSFYGAVKNPWALEAVPGGSSGGSAAAVAAGLAAAATGTDTGGSIRQPAALTGITGLKPTYGRVSRYGMIAFASSLDQGGPLTRSAQDAAMMLQAMAGFDTKDSTSIDKPVPDYNKDLNNSLQGLRIGLPKEYFGEGLAAEVEQCVQEAITHYRKMGAEIVEVSLPHTDLAIPTYYVIAPAECSANLSRFDGVRFGYRCKEPVDLEDLYKRSRGEGFGTEVKRRIMMGAYVLSAGYYDAYYLKAQRIRRLIRDDFLQAFEKVDVILGPTTPTPAFNLAEKKADPITMYLSDIYTTAVNLAGLPAISVPAGFVRGRPVGMQLIGGLFEEARLLNVAHKYQMETDWHLKTPQMSV
ncbi:Aspartyl-tRNA(Asn) amidotransferase subunit A @ Glutamyl-tRNA(Gln) amidotransferase subunit A [hydrothermal vent metagenome]|uniref:glutaminyl-tRNA synthase (glutamine-hydrolyzing) n=1 Tax=hydrothermal vent metagenome TaxID=652676 RepID=A0A3B0ZG05_9ZZZZ